MDRASISLMFDDYRERKSPSIEVDQTVGTMSSAATSEDVMTASCTPSWIARLLVAGACGAALVSACGSEAAPRRSAPSSTVESNPHAVRVAPTSGPPGAVISVEAGGCRQSSVRSDAGVQREIDVVVNLTTTDRQTGLDAKHVPVKPGGSWSATLTVPPATRPATYRVNAFCLMGGDTLLFDYTPVPFSVSGR